MPINDGYTKLTQQEIEDRLENNLQDLLSTSAEPGDLVTKQLEAEAKTLADVYEESLKQVYEAAYLEDASENELNKLVKLIGLSRREAVSATGTARFTREKPPTTDRTVPRGTVIQTGGIDPIEYVTTQKTALRHIDGFEDGSLTGWEGDTGSVSVVTTNNMTGDYALELPATSDVAINTVDEYRPGTVFGVDLYPNGDTVTGIQVGRHDASNFFEVQVDVGANDFRFREVSGGTEDRIVTENVTLSASNEVHVGVEWSLYGDHEAILYESSDRNTELASLFLGDQSDPDSETASFGVISKDAVATTLVDEVTTSAATVNIEADPAGIQTNISPNAITDIKGGLSGVDSVTNPVPTGDPNFVDTNLSQFISGREREEDEDLRERATQNTAIGGAATGTAISTAVNEVEGVQSVKIFNNRTDSTVDGLPGHSFELVVHGGEDQDIANALHRSSAIDSTDYGGAHGTEVTYTISDEVLAENETYHWSIPNEITLDITVTLIVDDTYLGDEEIKSRIVSYIGGTDTDGSFVPGTTPGENVYEAVVKNQLIDPKKTGVWEVDSLTIDKDNNGTDDTTTLASGADVLAVASSEIAQTNAREGSITVNTTSK